MPEEKKLFLKRFGIFALIALIIGGITLYIYSSHYESTDDAFIDAHIIPISPKVAGQVLAVHVNDNQAVKAGDPLLEIDPRDYAAKLSEQRGKVAAADAEARRAASDAKRYEQIFRQDEISQQQLDNAQAAATAAQATLAKERGALEQAELNLSYAKISAPEDGRVTKKSVEPGSYVQVGQTLFLIVPEHVWVTANFKETQLTHMQPGQEVTSKVDSYPGRAFTGHVESIQSGTGERFSVLPPENATGNYVKVVQRIPVKILIDTPPDPAFRLAPGMSVVPSVRVK
jgi:membrane fusion protein (multidrug efflux system)